MWRRSSQGHRPPTGLLQRQDYPGGQPDWYLLRFRNCTGCSLSGGGTLDGGGRRWVLPQARRQQQRKERVPAPGGWAQGRRQDADAPRKAVRNWRDPSCRRAEECRCAAVPALAACCQPRLSVEAA